jgi:hypothetical protein
MWRRIALALVWGGLFGLAPMSSQGRPEAFATVHSIDVTEYTNNEGHIRALFNISGTNLVDAICEEIVASNQHEGPRVGLESGPVLLFKDATGKILSAFQVRLDGALEPRNVANQAGSNVVKERISFMGKSFIKVKENGCVSHILSLWYAAHGK